MKKILLLCLFSMAFFQFGLAQKEKPNPGINYFEPTPEPIGGFYVESGASLYIKGGATLTLENTLLNNKGYILDSTGTVTFTGNSIDAANIGGDGITNLWHLTVNKSTGELSLDKDISVGGNLSLTSGNVFLNSGSIEFGRTGHLLNESETNRVYGTGGHLILQRDLNAPTKANPGNLGILITSSKNLGYTVIRREHKEFTISGGNTDSPPSILRSYGIYPENNSDLKATLEFNYLDAELNGNTEAELVAWKRMNTKLPWSPQNSSIDINANKIQIYNQNEFHQFTAHVVCPTVDISSNAPICEGENLRLEAMVSDTSSQTTYSWTGPNAFTSSEANPVISGIAAAGDGVYTLVVTENSCSVTATSSVSVYPLPAIPTITADNNTICKGGTAVLTGNCSTAQASFRWLTPAFASGHNTSALPSSNVRTVNEPGVYKGLCESKEGCLSAEVSITITQAGDCSGQNFITITPEKPAICPGGSITMSATGCAGTLSWLGGPTTLTGSSVSLSPGATTSYLVQCSTGGSGTFDIVVASNTLAVNTNVTTGKERFKAVTTLSSNKKVGDDDFTPGANVIYEAGNSITLLPGFEATKWSIFRAEIKVCN